MHVYEKERLHVVAECTAVEGRLISLHAALDGDLHIALDPERKSVLNLVNVMHAHGALVVEVICEHPQLRRSIRRSQFPMSAIEFASPAPTSPTVTTVGMKFIPLPASKFSPKDDSVDDPAFHAIQQRVPRPCLCALCRDRAGTLT